MFFVLIAWGASFAQKPPLLTKTLMDYMAQEQLYLTHSIHEIKTVKPPQNEQDYLKQKQKFSVFLAMNGAKIQSLEAFLDDQNKQQVHLNLRLKHLQQLPLTDNGFDVQKRVAAVETLIATTQKTLERINDNLSLATQYQLQLKDEINHLEIWHEKYQLNQQILNIKNEKLKLNKQLSVLYGKNFITDKTKTASKNHDLSLSFEVSRVLNNQKIELIHQMINRLNLQKRIIKAKTSLLSTNTVDTKMLQSITDTYRNAMNQYTEIEQSLQKMLVFLSNEKLMAAHSKDEKLIEAMQAGLKEELNNLESQKQIFNKELDEYQKQLKKLISSRQTLAEYSLDSWPVIFHKISAMPNQFYKYIKLLTLKVYDSYLWLDLIPTVLMWFSLCLVFVSSLVLSRFLNSLSLVKERTLMSGYLYDGVLTLIERNVPYLCIVSMLGIVLYFTNISYSHSELLFNLIAVWFLFRMLILVARLVLLERISDSSGKDVKLYYRLKWLLLFGGWATALMVFSHLLPLSLLLQDLFNRLFMLFILTISLVTWKSKDVIPYLLRPVLIGKKRYFKNVISLLVILIPVTLFTTAIIGIAGFINLSWTMSRYQGYVLIVLVSYILSRGLLFDLLELFSEWMISSLNNGWLWIEVFLKPIDKILRIVLLLLSILFLFQLFGWHSDSVVMVSLESLVAYTIINIPGIHVTVASAIEFFIVLFIFVWASKWTREFCYRWLYKEAKDVGIRNSLAVFTQYAVILLGGFITLRILGLDFSGMSMILGGLAVGMGFGLRDFASNIVGGIMLLIERPVREGDLISIGEYEGQVSHIGIRSMRVSSWDNTEVLIPNAETFNKPFTNWTHQDGIVRTVIPIKVSRSDDPVMIQQLILDVLAIIPEIVSEPPAQVFLKKIDEALIEFEARYFINVQVHSRVEVRSKVLFAITAQFKAAGVKPPIEPITVELKEGQSDFFSTQQSAKD